MTLGGCYLSIFCSRGAPVEVMYERSVEPMNLSLSLAYMLTDTYAVPAVEPPPPPKIPGWDGIGQESEKDEFFKAFLAPRRACRTS